jgi:hypothetical protein
MISFFPIVISAVVGLQAANRDAIYLLQSMGASRWQMLMKLQFPNAFRRLEGGYFTGRRRRRRRRVHRQQLGSGLRAPASNRTYRHLPALHRHAWLMMTGIALFYTVNFLENRLTGRREKTGGGNARVTESARPAGQSALSEQTPSSGRTRMSCPRGEPAGWFSAFAGPAARASGARLLTHFGGPKDGS